MKAAGERLGLPELHPHAFCYRCGAELLCRTEGNLRAVQAHLCHADIQTTTVYTRLRQPDLQYVVSVFDNLGTYVETGFASGPGGEEMRGGQRL